MTEDVEGQTPSEEEQPPVEPAPVSGDEEEQLSQQGSQDEVLAKVSDLEKQLRGLQSKQDKVESSLEKRLQALGVELSPEQKRQNDILNLQDELAKLKGDVPSVDVVPSSKTTQTNVDSTPVTAEAVKDMIAEALKPAPTGASAVSPSGETTPSSEVNAEQAAKEIDELRASKQVSQWTPQEEKHVEELMQIIAKEVD